MKTQLKTYLLKIFLIMGAFVLLGFNFTQAQQFVEQGPGGNPVYTDSSGNPVVSGAGLSGGGNKLVDAQIQNPIVYNNFYDFVAAIIDTTVKILMPFVVLAFVFAGFLFVKAQGNETELTAAKKTLGYSIVGAFILLGAWSFAQIIGTTITAITPPTN